jgi:RNA polymerase sigma factor (sigma-70 family)
MEKKYSNEELFDKSIDLSLSPERRSYYQGICVLQNIGLITREAIKICGGFTANPTMMEDLLAEGKFGWLVGMSKFDKKKYPDIKITTYCMPWAIAYMKSFYKNNCKQVKILTTDAKKKAAVLLAKNETKYQDSDGNIDFSKMSVENFIKEDILREVNDALAVRYISVSPNDDEDIPVLDLKSSAPSPHVLLAKEESKKMLETKLALFMQAHTGVSRSIIENRMMSLLTENKQLTLEEIGAKFSLTKQSINQIEQTLLEKFRKQLLPVAVELRGLA